MKNFYSVTALAVLLSVRFCEHTPEPPVQPALIVKTIDGAGKPVPSLLVYEPQDCEYDFNKPLRESSNAYGITVLKNLPAGPVQLYADGFLYESYRCLQYSGGIDTLTVYAAPIPTYIVVKDQCGKPVNQAKVIYFANESGNCDYEKVAGTEVVSDAQGKATIYLPQGNTYKLQLAMKKQQFVQCFQPSQYPETVAFVLPCK